MKPVFIFGSDPSSTAFLSALLAAHPACVPTPQFSYAYLRASRSKFLSHEEAVAALGFYSHPQDGDLELPPQTDLPSFVGRLVRTYASDHGHPGADLWLEQVKLDQLPLLADTFSEARFIHLVQDGRTVAAAPWQAEQPTLAQMGRAWKRGVTRGLEAEMRLGPERCERVGYETLLGDLSVGLETLASFIGVCPQGFRIPDSVLYKDYTPHLYAWRTQLSARELKLFEAENGPLLTRLGYGLAASGVSPARPDVWLRAGQQPTRPTPKVVATRPTRLPSLPEREAKAVRE